MPIYKSEGKKNGLQKYLVRINYKDQFGNPRQLTRTAYGRAEALELERKLAEGEKTVIRAFTELYTAYLEHLKISVRQTSYIQMEKSLRLYVLPVFQNSKLTDLNTASLQKWKTDLAARDLSISSLQNVYTAFNAMLSFGEKMEYLPKNPLRKIGNFRQALFEPPAEKMKYYTPDQYILYAHCALEYAVKHDDYRYYTFFSIAFYTGMRKGEINALRWSDIEGNIIHVRRSIAQTVKGSREIETPPKTKSSYRDIQAPEPLIQILRMQKEYQKRDPAFTEDFRVCGGYKILSDAQIRRMNFLFADLAGLPRITVHDFRHSHASLLANEGINIQEIARRLGHSNVALTLNIYSHLYPKEEERAIRILNRIK